ncbi:ArnT family glycosyltransferase [Polluticoccus soli]|uniref:ArnT family glycosyltransferase n=1 Tax=Polluticoccus soli TaxID=3034150 RepID=UPI0023E2D206|nr:glycosyltransferase family 39 protein [Flavipsychrobacter sp. JY13-12]
MTRKALLSVTLFIIILFFFCSTYYHEMLHMWPRGIHDWAQADRLSLAINFYDRGMNFFLPATHNLWPIDGITGVEFPIQSYVAAIGAKIFGRNHISTLFRLLDVLISCTGLLFLFLACYRATKDFVFSLVPPLFMFCSPIYIYYTCNYLPDAAACSIAFMSFYFLLIYLDKPTTKPLLFAIGLLTLASLIKTSIALYLFGFLGYVFLQRVLRKHDFTKRSNFIYALAALLSVGALSFYYFYNQYLNNKYHSDIFMSAPHPFDSWQEVSYYFNSAFKQLWLPEYFVLPQYLMFFVIVTAAIPLLFATRDGKRRIFMLLIFLAGVLCVGALMGGQLLIHDYYVVSIFFPLVAFAVLVSVIAIRKAIIYEDALRSMRIAMGASVLIIFFFADFHIHKRLKPDYGEFKPGIPWAENGAWILQEANVPKNEKVVVLNEDAPNIALLYLDRRGWTIPSKQRENMAELKAIMRKLDATVVVCEEGLGRSIMENDTAVASLFKTLALKDRVAVFQLR